MHTHAQPTFHENDKMTTAAVYISTLVSVITKQIEGSVSNKARAAVSLTNVLLPTASVREMKFQTLVISKKKPRNFHRISLEIYIIMMI